MTEIRFPSINDTGSDREQLKQIGSYLFQLVEQLNVALGQIGGAGDSRIVQTASPSAPSVPSEAQAKSNFAAIKSLIIKSADIVSAYYEEIEKRLRSVYVAESDFGTYKEETEAQLQASSSGIKQLYSHLQSIESELSEIEDSVIAVNAHIKTGLLYYDSDGAPVYGLELGQKNTVDGVETFNKYARFTSDRLSFYDKGDNEVAYISDYKLYITHAEVTGSFRLGEYLIDATDGLAFNFVG